MVFAIILTIAIIALIAYLWVKFVYAIFNPFIKRAEKKEEQQIIDNPYIEAHLLRRQNDEDYEQYLKWLDECGGDLPMDKRLTIEEQRFKQKLGL